MQHQGTAMLTWPEARTDTAISSPVVSGLRELADSLPYSELAVALYASDMPTRYSGAGTAPLSQVAAWATQGLARLGEARVWQLDYRSRRSALRPGPEYDLIWPNRRRTRTAHNLSFTYDRMRAAQGHARPCAETVYVPVVVDEIGEVWEIGVYRRDLENGERWGWPAPVTAGVAR